MAHRAPYCNISPVYLEWRKNGMYQHPSRAARPMLTNVSLFVDCGPNCLPTCASKNNYCTDANILGPQVRARGPRNLPQGYTPTSGPCPLPITPYSFHKEDAKQIGARVLTLLWWHVLWLAGVAGVGGPGWCHVLLAAGCWLMLSTGEPMGAFLLACPVPLVAPVVYLYTYLVLT